MGPFIFLYDVLLMCAFLLSCILLMRKVQWAPMLSVSELVRSGGWMSLRWFLKLGQSAEEKSNLVSPGLKIGLEEMLRMMGR